MPDAFEMHPHRHVHPSGTAIARRQWLPLCGEASAAWREPLRCSADARGSQTYSLTINFLEDLLAVFSNRSAVLLILNLCNSYREGSILRAVRFAELSCSR